MFVLFLYNTLDPLRHIDRIHTFFYPRQNKKRHITFLSGNTAFFFILRNHGASLLQLYPWVSVIIDL